MSKLEQILDKYQVAKKIGTATSVLCSELYKLGRTEGAKRLEELSARYKVAKTETLEHFSEFKEIAKTKGIRKAIKNDLFETAYKRREVFKGIAITAAVAAGLVLVLPYIAQSSYQDD